MYKAVVFDFDGVVINSTELQHKAFYESYKAVGGKGLPSFHEFLMHSGDSLPNIFLKMNLPLEMVVPYQEISSRGIDCIKVHEGIRELIMDLKKDGYKCGLCTGKDRERTIKILKVKDLEDCFDIVVCSDDVENPKPHPESLIRVLKKLNADFTKSTMIGDAKNDIVCAKLAGIKSIGVMWGDNSRDVLYKEHPDAIVENMKELFNAIIRLSNDLKCYETEYIV